MASHGKGKKGGKRAAKKVGGKRARAGKTLNKLKGGKPQPRAIDQARRSGRAIIGE